MKVCRDLAPNTICLPFRPPFPASKERVVGALFKNPSNRPLLGMRPNVKQKNLGNPKFAAVAGVVYRGHGLSRDRYKVR